MEIWVQGQEPSEVPVRHSVTSAKKKKESSGRKSSVHDTRPLRHKNAGKKDLQSRRHLQIP